MPVYAQSDYNPTNPKEPFVIDYCKLNVTADPAEGAYVSGSGRYKVNGSGSVYISTSARNTEDYTYTFKYWTLNGEIYTYSQYFYYYPQKGEMDFVAHYEKKEVEFDPSNPAEPNGTTIKRKHYLYVTSSIDGACSFNIASGNKYEEGQSVYLRVYTNAYYRFDGWRVNGEIISTSSSFYYTIPTANATVEAVMTELPYDPDSPIDPPSSGEQGSIDDTDANRQLITLTIGNDANTSVDKTRVVFNENKSLEYESDCDAAKFMSTDAAYQIYSHDTKGIQYQINERPRGDGTVNIGIVVANEGTVRISTSRLDCEDAVLVDKLLNVKHPLATGAYTFSSAAGTFDNRFVLQIPVESPVKKGDVNDDGNVTFIDYTSVINWIIGKPVANFNEKAADVNGDGQITFVDASGIINIIIGK